MFLEFSPNKMDKRIFAKLWSKRIHEILIQSATPFERFVSVGSLNSIRYSIISFPATYDFHQRLPIICVEANSISRY